MIPALTCIALLSGAPRGLADAELITWAPKASEVATVLPFFTRAGAGSVMLSPSSWRESAHALLAFDVTRPESMSALGIAVNEGLTLTVRGPVSVSCHALSDVRAFEAAVKDRLARYGTFSRTEAAGVVTLSSRDGLNRIQGAALIKGRESCSVFAAGQSVETLLPEALKALTGKPLAGPPVTAAKEQPAVQSFLLPERARPGGPAWATVGVSTRADTLTLDARGRGVPVSALAGAGASPYGRLQAPGVLTARVRFPKEALPGLLAQVFPGLPVGQGLAPAARELAPLLTGNAALVFSRVKVTSGLRTPIARFFAARVVLLAETSDPAAARALIDAIDAKRLAFREGTLLAGVTGSTVWLATEAEVKDRVLALLESSAGPQKHGAEVDIDPAALAKALSAVPLVEVLQSPELSGVLVAATELGPLLLMTERIRGWLDSTGPGLHRGQLQWSLTPERADGGTAPGVP